MSQLLNGFGPDVRRHYCTAACQQSAWRVHKGTCGRPLPTLQLVREASVEAACGILEEYGGGHAELAIACVRRSFELLHNKRQAHVLEERLSAFTCAVVHALLSFPAHTQLQLVGSHWLGWFGDRDAALAAGATQEMLRKRTVAR